jgi:hypothetical protein
MSVVRTKWEPRKFDRCSVLIGIARWVAAMFGSTNLHLRLRQSKDHFDISEFEIASLVWVVKDCRATISTNVPPHLLKD